MRKVLNWVSPFLLLGLVIAGVFQFGGTEEAKADVAVTPWPTQADDGYHLVTDTLTSTGVWTAPDGVTSAVVELWGGGGAGDEDVGAGGGGAYVRSLVSVTPGNSYYVVVGDGGALTGLDGATSTFATTTVVAAPGWGGRAAGRGLGGATASSTGDIEFAGGNGLISTGNAGGGSGAGDFENGVNGTSTGERSGGQRGGGSGAHATTNSDAAHVPGGGGKSEATSGQQTAGQRGEARITYQIAQTVGFPTVRSTSWGQSTTTAITWSIQLPEVQAGDLLILAHGTIGLSGVITPSGWTLLSKASTTGVGIRQIVYYKVSDGTETQLDIQTSGVAEWHQYYAWSVDNYSGTPFVASSTGLTTIIDPPNLDTGVSDKYLWLISATLRGGSNVVSTYNVTSTSAGYGSFKNLSPIISGVTQLNLPHTSYKLTEAQSDDPGVFFFADGGGSFAAHTIAIAGAAASSETDPTITSAQINRPNWGASMSAGGSLGW